MRGGMLVLAPIVDAISRRKVKWFSWVALALSLGALLAAAAVSEIKRGRGPLTDDDERRALTLLLARLPV